MPQVSLRAVDGIRPLYILPADPLADEVLVPGFRAADSVDCMVGFFTSEILAALAPGLATYIASSSQILRLIVSPYLRDEDLAVFSGSHPDADAIISNTLEDLTITEDLLATHTLKCLAWLLYTNRMQFKIALMRGALFHPKVWMFRSGDDALVVHGSSNATYSGLRRNIEQVAVSCSWADPIQRYITDKLQTEFAQLWDNARDDSIVVDLPEAVRRHLLRTYKTEIAPTETDLLELYKEAASTPSESSEFEPTTAGRRAFVVPSWLNYDSGPFAHQGEAVKAWRDAAYNGVLEMATGSGKTITAMVGAHMLSEQHKPLLIVVAAPYVPLIQQWCDELEVFGLEAVNLTTSGGQRGRANDLGAVRRRLAHGRSDVEAIVVSHTTLCSPAFQAELEQFKCNRLLIADEAHNLGAEGFTSRPPEFFEFRLGLSATPVRQYDDEGTAALFSYFGPVAYRFTLEQAIGHCLVEYDYFVHQCSLSHEEMDKWRDLTEKIRANAWRQEKGRPDDYLQKLYRDRRALLECAESKLERLERLLAQSEARRVRHTLVYTTDKDPAQLDAVNAILRTRGILFHQLTYEETGSRSETAGILRAFQDGDLQVLTAKRVLDEGVNIPQISTAYILASTTVERQWVQRRGRLLRTCPEIGKTHSEIHDFIALPPDMDTMDPEARTVIKSELQRVQEFARLARNAGRPDGPLSVIHQLTIQALT